MNTTTNTTFLPGQLLRVTRTFHAWDNNQQDTHQVNPGTIILFLSVSDDKMISKHSLAITTSFITSSGTVLEADWFTHPFVDYQPNVEPVYTP